MTRSHNNPSAASMHPLGRRSHAQDIPLSAIWLRYLSFGGDATPVELEAYLHEALIPSGLDAVRIAHAIWELEQFGS